MKWRNISIGVLIGLVLVLGVQLVFLGGQTVVGAVYHKLAKPVTTSQSMTGQEFADKVDEIYQKLDGHYLEKIDRQSFYTNALKGVVDSLGDPYTAYYTKKEYADLMRQMDGNYEGIGVPIMYLGKSKEVVIIAPYKDSPGEKAGLLTGDIIRRVNDEDVTGLDIDKVAEKIRGKGGTVVRITVERQVNEDKRDIEKLLTEGKGESELIELSVTRDRIEIPTIAAKMLEDKIGYLQIYGFDGPTYDQFVIQLKKLKEEGMNGLIIDLRGNPGGYLQSVVAIADEIIGKDLVVYIEDKNGQRENYQATNERALNLPIVVLIDKRSASASEILAGVLKDYQLATLVGTTTFGKGLVQETFLLEDKSALKVTIAKYYTPDGHYIHGKGIEPDVEVAYKKEDGVTYDNQLRKAIEVMQEKLKKD